MTHHILLSHTLVGTVFGQALVAWHAYILCEEGTLRDAGTDLLKVEIPKLSTDSGINRIGCSILELIVREVGMVLIVEI